MTQIVAVDIGGTHARFTIATIGSGTISLADPVTFKTGDFSSLQTAWEAFENRHGAALPKAAAIAIAGPITGDAVQMTNNTWTIHTGRLDDQLGVDRFTVLNDFAAVAHAVANAGAADFIHLCGPDAPLPDTGTISVIGPGTGLGVAHFIRADGTYHVQATEGGHIEFAPLDAVDDLIHQRLRARHRRVSVERVVSGPGIVEILAGLAEFESRAVPEIDDRTIWERGIRREDALCAAAVDRFCQLLGAVAGDFALGHGAGAVVIAGGLGFRIRETLLTSGFAERFRFKGRYEQMMSNLPVKLIVHPQPGLFGAAAAFMREHLA